MAWGFRVANRRRGADPLAWRRPGCQAEIMVDPTPHPPRRGRLLALFTYPESTDHPLRAVGAALVLWPLLLVALAVDRLQPKSEPLPRAQVAGRRFRRHRK
jgi:hypothetical protein